MSDNSTDFYHQKTDAELLFFVEHPDYYQPSLVESARRELRRRGVTFNTPVAHTETVLPSSSMDAPSSGFRTGPLTLLLAGLLLLSVGVYYYLNQRSEAARELLRARAATARKTPPRLTEVATAVIPTYDVPAIVAQQLARVPAAERAAATRAGQPLRQYQELAKRFWAAETQTEYLTNQAHAGKTSEVFLAQTLLARQTWQAWNKAVAYGYKFGPVMDEHFQRMQEVASSQQHILESLPDLLPNRQFLTDKEMVSREAEVQDWLSNLLPASPVTGQPYKATVVTIKM